jgi:hypothetical protein
MLKREAGNADIILNFASTIEAVRVLAIAEALETRRKQASSPAYWIQMSGGSIYIADELKNKRFGYASNDSWDDIRDIDRIIDTINAHPSKVSEQIILRQSPHVVRTALLPGPLIYGRGRGLWNKRTIQPTEIAKTTLQLGHGFRLNGGKNLWNNIHVADLGGLVGLLLKAATEGRNDGLWNRDGIYHPENGKMVSL